MTTLKQAERRRDKRAVKEVAHDAKSDALADSVFRVVAAYVAHHGGKVIVAGPLQIQGWPGDGGFRFTIAIPCTGRKPNPKEGAPRVR